MRLVGLILLVALSGCAVYPEKVEWTTTNKMMLAGAIAGQTADVISTEDGLNRGCVELNPIVGEDPNTGSLIALKVVGLGLLYGAIEYLVPPANRQTMRNVGYGIFGVVGAGAAIHNYNVECN